MKIAWTCEPHPGVRRAGSGPVLRCPPSAGGGAGRADDEFGLEQHAPVLVGAGVVVRLLQQQLRRELTHPDGGLPDGGERYGSGGGELDVVVADDGDILRHPHPGRVERLQDAEGEQVVGAEDGGGTGDETEQPGPGVAAGGDVEPVGGDFDERLGGRPASARAARAPTLRSLIWWRSPRPLT